MNMKTTSREIVVIGAGIVGMACASFIQRAGHRVTVLDRGAPGEGTSFGNAGCLNSSSVVPISMPGVLSQVPRWLLDPEGPLVLRWRYLPVLAPWLWRFVRAGAPDKVAAQARALRALLGSTIESYAPLVKAAGAEDLVHRLGHLTVYKSEESFAKDGRAMGLRRENGVVVEDLSFDELRQLEPTLSRDFVRGRMIAETGHVGDPYRLVTRLAEAFTRDGGRILREAARGFEFADGAVTGVRGDSGSHRADRVVLAAGAWSKTLARQLGDAVPLDKLGGRQVFRDADGDGAACRRHRRVRRARGAAGLAPLAHAAAPGAGHVSRPFARYRRRAHLDVDGVPPEHAGFASGHRTVAPPSQRLPRLRPRPCRPHRRRDDRAHRRRPGRRCRPADRHYAVPRRPLRLTRATAAA